MHGTRNLTESQTELLEVVESASGSPLPDLLGRRRKLDPGVSRESHASDYDWLLGRGLIAIDGWAVVLTDSGREVLQEYRAEHGCTVADWRRHVAAVTGAGSEPGASERA